MTDRNPPPRISRRRALVASGAGVAAALLAACEGGRATDTPAPATATSTRAQETPAAPVGTSTPVEPTAPSSQAPPTTQPPPAATPVPTAGAAATGPASPVAETFATPTGTPATPLIAFVGASMVYGLGVERTETFPAQTMALLVSARYDAVNLGEMNGVTLAELLTRAPKTIDPLYAASRGKNILVLGGTNDLGAGASLEQAYGRMVTFCEARRKVGFRVVVLTILPNSVALSGGRTYEAERQRYNTNIRTNLANFADALADVAANPTIGAPGAQMNRTYYQSDGTHPTATTYRIVASIVAPAILSV